MGGGISELAAGGQSACLAVAAWQAGLRFTMSGPSEKRPLVWGLAPSEVLGLAEVGLLANAVCHVRLALDLWL